MVRVYNGMLLSHEKEQNNTIYSNMDATRDYHINARWSKPERERQVPYDIIYTWNLKYDPNEPTYERETKIRDTANRPVAAKGVRGGREGRKGNFGLAHANWHVYIEWIRNKVLLYSKGNYINILW